MPAGSTLAWLIFEGAVPLLGTAVLFLLWGVCRKVTTNKPQRAYAWGHAIDPIGWLYGAAVVAFGAGMKSIGHNMQTLTVFCFFAAGICMLVLISALTERAEDAQWAPTTLLKWVALGLVVVILVAGCQVNSEIAEESKGGSAGKGKAPEAGASGPGS